jgi:hypothetical protein
MTTARAFDDRDDRPSGQVLAFCFDESFNFFPTILQSSTNKISPQSARCVIPSIDFR